MSFNKNKAMPKNSSSHQLSFEFEAIPGSFTLAKQEHISVFTNQLCHKDREYIIAAKKLGYVSNLLIEKDTCV